jgi:hypothetical protein
MLKRRPVFFLFWILIASFLTGCLAVNQTPDPVERQVQEVVAATLTKEAFIQSIESARETEQIAELASATPENTELPSATPTPSQTPTPEPAPRLVPGSVPAVQMSISDLVTVDRAQEKTAVGDVFSWGRLERPYTPRTMVYKRYLDIYQANLAAQNSWIYITIVLIGNLPEEGEISYAVELDTDHDGRGDFLVLADLPPQGSWTTEGVSVHADGNDDIGGIFPAYEEQLEEPGDGFETVIFENGIGEDQDLAWVRRDPDNRNQIQIAFKNTLVGDLGFLWSIWADEGLRDPALYDFNDHFTFDEAGSPNKGNYRYPVKAVALIDSTCKGWYGYLPSGLEAGLCYTGDLALGNQSGYGWCEPDPIYSGCKNSNACYGYCPKNRFCIPCRLP